MSIELAHEPEASRYTLTVDGQLAVVLDYKANEHAISMTRTFTVPSFRGQKLAAQLVEFAVDDVEANDSRRIVPMCWYVADWFEAHGERGHLLSER
ncbi:MAG TPA: GNAT family N-acetyltransferase [Microbacteriaceae bacterium]|nr:GNAT family N-acetyltransferase [Microbacteriaceae bacterium]